MSTAGIRRAGWAALWAAAALAAAGCGGSPSAPATATTAAASPSPSSPSATPSGTASAAATSTVSGIAQGFPSTLIPLMPGATAKATSFDASTTPAGAVLVATTNAPVAEALAFYSASFTGQGFTAVPAASPSAAPGTGAPAQTLDFVRADGQETANVSAVTANGVTTVTVGASVAPANFK
ncbi:hypothetical protein [Sinomonas mesophila]|uniref:hypothetical protein n=1 Tax=Sinomonas mesophila TaxID=1531955 RepID=UPI0009855E7D|nr:hypothetical protein [Sinomonas mesophila]